DRCVGRGELDETRQLLGEVADVAPAEELTRLGLELAQRATAADRPSLAADTYELLRARGPASRAVWEPLFRVPRRLGDTDGLTTLVSGTLPNLVAATDRNALRLRYATYLVDKGRKRDAVESLRDLLLDDPDNLEASALLERILIEEGDEETLADF